jgi:GT2 family glycosyltransferase
MKVSIVIPTYNRNGTLRKTLENVLQFKEQYHELILVDQTPAHDDDMRRYLDSLRDEQKIILVTPDYPNLPAARNRGIEKASADIIIFIDDDVSITPGFIAGHLRQYEDPDTGGVTGRVEIANTKTGENIVFSGGGGFKKKVKSLLFFFLRKKASYVTPFGILSDFTGNRKLPADTGIGCNMSFRRTVFGAAGNFDENYTGNAYREDTDMAIRVRRAGYKIVYAPEAALVHHMENSGGTRNAEPEAYWRIYFKNQCYFHIKNFHSPRIFIMVFSLFDLLWCKKSGLAALTLFNNAYAKALSIIKESR